MSDRLFENLALAPGDIVELAAKKAETSRQLEELAQKLAEDTQNLRDAFEARIGEPIRLGGKPYGWVNYSQGGGFEVFDGSVELSVSDRQLIRVIPDGMDEEDPSFMVVVRVPELGEKGDVIFQDEDIVFADNPQQLES